MPRKTWIAAALFWLSLPAAAQNPRVLLDIDQGPLLIELDQQEAPLTTANFLAYVDAGRYDNTLLHRVVRDFVVQGGGFKADGTAVALFPDVASERNNALVHLAGTIAVALPSNPQGVPQVDAGDSGFFINTTDNPELDEHYTVFGRVLWGGGNLQAMNALPVFLGSEQPIRLPLLRRAVRVAPGEFPILPLHTGAWYDPANSGRGILLEVAAAAGAETGPMLVLSWYDFFEGQQVWMTGVAPFQWGAHEVAIPLRIASGGQFGADFDPAQVEQQDWGTITVRFTGCGTGEFSYESAFGNGTLPLRALTLPTQMACSGN